MGNTDTGGGCLVVLSAFVVPVVVFVGSGLLAWRWIEPDTFWRGVLFVFVWGVLTYLLRLVAVWIIGGIAMLFGKDL